MEFLSTFLPIVLYTLTSILLVVLIVISLKIVKLLDKLDTLADDAAAKLKSLNSVFNVIDNFTDKVSLISDKMILGVTGVLSKVFNRKRKDDYDE